MSHTPEFLPSPRTLHAVKRLVRHTKWSQGFWLGYVFTVSPPQVHILQDRIAQTLRERGDEVRVIRPQTPAELESLTSVILGEQYEGCTFVEVIRDTSTTVSLDAPEWRDAWGQFILRLNERREAARETLTGGLVIAAHPSSKPMMRDGGPDLWSIRSFVFELPPGAREPGREGAGSDHDLGASLELLALDDADQRHAPPEGELLEAEIRSVRAGPLVNQPLERHASALLQLGTRLAASGRTEQAVDTTREAVQVYRRLAAERPDAWLPDLATGLNNLGIRLSELGQREDALAATQEAVAVYEELAQARPDAFLPELARALNNIGVMLSGLGRREDPVAAAEQAAHVYRQLAKARPDAFLPNLARALNNFGGMLSARGRREEALAATEEAVTVYRELAKARPDAFLPELASALNNVGIRLGELGRREESAAATEEAVAIHRELAKPHPGASLPD